MIEDRGNLGVNGERILRVSPDGEGVEPLEWEVPEQGLVRAA